MLLKHLILAFVISGTQAATCEVIDASCRAVIRNDNPTICSSFYRICKKSEVCSRGTQYYWRMLTLQ